MKDKITVVSDGDCFCGIYVGDKKVYEGDVPSGVDAYKAIGLKASEIVTAPCDDDENVSWPDTLSELQKQDRAYRRKEREMAKLYQIIEDARIKLSKLENE